MELDELKSSWQMLSEKVEKQQRLNAKLIEQMTNHNYRSRLNKIVYPEFIGSIICFIGVFLLLWNFDKLNTVLLQVAGGLCVLFLVVLPILSISSIRGLQTINMSLSSYADTLKQFAIKKIRFQKIQKLTVSLNFGFMIAFAPVCVRMADGKDITQSTRFWVIILPLCLVAMFFVSRWVLRHYNNALKQAETLLTEIEL